MATKKKAKVTRGKKDDKKSGTEVAKPLARPGDPLIGPDGRPITPEPISRTPATDVSAEIDARTFKPQKQRALRDLPAPADTIKAVACVFMFTLLGIGDRETAHALGISIEQVRQVREHSAYGECFGLVVSEFINANSDHIQSRLAAYTHGALSQVAHIAFFGEKESNKLRASQGILDMGGHAKKDATKVGDSLANELRIVVVDGEGASVNVHVNGG